MSDEIASCKPLAGIEPHLEKFLSVDITERKMWPTLKEILKDYGLVLDALEIVFPSLYTHSVGWSSLGIGCGSRDSINQTRSALLMIARFRLGRGTNVSETDRVMSNRHMADAI